MYPETVHGWAIPERHLSEAAFLWGQLERISLSPRHGLEDAIAQEQRLLAHLDGLVIGGAPVATHLLKPALEEEDVALISSAAAALLSQEPQVSDVLKRLLEEAESQHLAIGRALERCEREDLEPRLTALPATLPHTARAAVLEAQAVRGLDAGAALPQWAKSVAPEVVAAALRAARVTPGRVEPRMFRAALGSPVPDVRGAAIDLGLILGSRSAWKDCQQWVAQRAPGCRHAMERLALGGEAVDVEPLLALTHEPALREHAVWALGFSGRVAVADAALGWMRDASPRFAKVAAEAFCAITGLRLEGDFLQLEEDEEEEEDLEADLKPQPEANLARAYPEQVEAWWKKARGRFDPKARYLQGQPLGAASLLTALVHGPMRRRHLLAWELTCRSRSALSLQTRASARLQHRWLLNLPRPLKEADLRAPLKQLLTQE